jgi:polyribonucleotide nucleotidyltransferase
MVLVTARRLSQQPRDIDFMPLTCEYRENFYCRRIPGSFFRREVAPPTRSSSAG